MKLEFDKTLEAVLDRAVPCECGLSHHVKTRRVAVREGLARRGVPQLLEPLGMLDGPGLLLSDRTVYETAGDRIYQQFIDRGHGMAVEVLAPAPGEDEVHATTSQAGDVTRVLQSSGARWCLAVGSGTINDLAKRGSTLAGVPYAVFGTAASMNGYGSPIAALMEEGLKVTTPCTPPVAILADPEVLAAAPASLTEAGLGDFLSKSVSDTDWWLASRLLGERYCERPSTLVAPWERACRSSATAVRDGEPTALATLVQALILSGFGMVWAGSSSPASGGEHLLSHWWDMTASMRGREIGLHGSQVAVGTLVSSTLYEMLLELPKGTWGRGRSRSTPGREGRGLPGWLEGQLSEHPAGMRDSVLGEARKKSALEPGRGARRKALRAAEDELRAELRRRVIPAEETRQVLRAAGVPTTLAELGIAHEEAREALRLAPWMRARYTVLDLARDLDVLPARIDELLHRSGILEDQAPSSDLPAVDEDPLDAWLPPLTLD